MKHFLMIILKQQQPQYQERERLKIKSRMEVKGGVSP